MTAPAKKEPMDDVRRWLMPLLLSALAFLGAQAWDSNKDAALRNESDINDHTDRINDLEEQQAKNTATVGALKGRLDRLTEIEMDRLNGDK